MRGSTLSLGLTNSDRKNAVDLRKYRKLGFSEFQRSKLRILKREAKKEKNQKHTLSLPEPPLFLFYIFIFFYLLSFIIIIIILIWIHSSYYFIRVRFYPENFYFFSVHFILNELSTRHFLTSKIFVTISFLKSLVTYHLENRQIFRLS